MEETSPTTKAVSIDYATNETAIPVSTPDCSLLDSPLAVRVQAVASHGVGHRENQPFSSNHRLAAAGQSGLA